MSECIVSNFGEPTLPVLRSDIKGALTGSIPLPFFSPWTPMHCLELWQLFWDHEGTNIGGWGHGNNILRKLRREPGRSWVFGRSFGH